MATIRSARTEHRHPLHAPVTDLPVAAFAASLVFDALSFVGGTAFVQAAFYNIAIGLLAALLSALTGLVDYSRLATGTRATRVGLVHAATNLVGTAVFGASLWYRTWNIGLETTPIPALVLSLLGVAIIGFGAYLGHQLVYRLGANVATVPDALEPEPEPLAPTMSRPGELPRVPPGRTPPNEPMHP